MANQIQTKSGEILEVSVVALDELVSKITAINAAGQVVATAELNIQAEEDEDGEVDGIANLHPEVTPAYRRQGIATALYQFAAKIAHEVGVKLAASDNLTADAIHVWESLTAKKIAKLGEI